MGSFLRIGKISFVARKRKGTPPFFNGFFRKARRERDKDDIFFTVYMIKYVGLWAVGNSKLNYGEGSKWSPRNSFSGSITVQLYMGTKHLPWLFGVTFTCQCRQHPVLVDSERHFAPAQTLCRNGNMSFGISSLSFVPYLPWDR